MAYPDKDQIVKILELIEKGKIKPTRFVGKDEPPIDQMKFNLCQRMIRFKREQELTSQHIAKILDIGPAVVSRIMHCEIDRFKVDSLLNYYFALLISTDNDKLVAKFKKEVASFLKNVA
jgi:hypothetical protein